MCNQHGVHVAAISDPHIGKAEINQPRDRSGLRHHPAGSFVLDIMQYPFAQEIVSLAGHEHVKEPVELPAEGFAMRLYCLRLFVGIDEKS